MKVLRTILEIFSIALAASRAARSGDVAEARRVMLSA